MCASSNPRAARSWSTRARAVSSTSVVDIVASVSRAPERRTGRSAALPGLVDPKAGRHGLVGEPCRPRVTFVAGGPGQDAVQLRPAAGEPAAPRCHRQQIEVEVADDDALVGPVGLGHDPTVWVDDHGVPGPDLVVVPPD